MKKNIKRVGILTGGGVMFKIFLDCRILPWFKFGPLWNYAQSLRCGY